MTYGWTTAPVDAQTKAQLEELSEALEEPQSTILRYVVRGLYEDAIGDPEEPHVVSLPQDEAPAEDRAEPRSPRPQFNL